MIFRLTGSLISVGIILLALCGTAGANPADQMDKCNKLYHDAAYPQAITCYEKIGTSSDILFNIGNSYARMEQPGNAILYYLRSLCLAPDDPDIAANLAHLRKTYSLFPPAPSFADQVFGALTISHWTQLCGAVVVVYLLFLAVSMFRARGRKSIAVGTICGVLLLTLCGTGAWYHFDLWKRSVVVSDTRLLVSPFEKSESVGAIAPGRLVSPNQVYRGYVYVTDETGRNGWLPADSVQPIIPAAE